MDTIQITMAVVFTGIIILALACSLYFNIFEKEGSKENGSRGGFWKFILAIIVVILIFALIGMCGDGAPWSPRHT